MPTVTIKVTDPATKRSIEWTALNKASALKQAKIEVERGALVTVTVGSKIEFSNEGKS